MTGHREAGAGPDRDEPSGDGPGIDIEADLVIDVDAGPRGRTTAYLSGSGQELRLRAIRPEILVAAAGRTVGSTVSELVGGAGVRAELHGPRRRIAVVDPAHSSRFAARALGDPHLHIDPAGWGVLTRAAVSARPWQSARRRPSSVALAGGGVAAIAAALVLRRHRRRGVGGGGDRG